MLTDEQGNQDAARRLLDTLQTTYVTFSAQADLRDALYSRMRVRFPGSAALEDQDFFSRHFADMTAEELRLHATMRSYTVHAMYEYNKQALALVRDRPGLTQQVPRLAELEHHLDVWMDKYENTFLHAPHMSLCYVGGYLGCRSRPESKTSCVPTCARRSSTGEMIRGRVDEPRWRNSPRRRD